MVELRLFRYFIAVAEELHFGRAAEKIGIAQPPLSQQIQVLERELGVRLFDRTNRKVELTDAGMALLGEARKALAAADYAVEEARRAGRGQVGRLAIGMVGSITYQEMIPEVIRTFRERYPNVAIHLQECSTPQQVEAIRRGELHIGFVRPPVSDHLVKFETVMRESMVLALPASHPFASRKRIAIKELANEPWITLPPGLGLGFYEQVMNLCAKAGFQPSLSQVAVQMHTMLSLVAGGLGVTVVPESVSHADRKGIVYVEIAGATPPVETAAAYLKTNRSPILGNFLKILRGVSSERQSTPLLA